MFYLHTGFNLPVNIRTPSIVELINTSSYARWTMYSKPEALQVVISPSPLTDPPAPPVQNISKHSPSNSHQRSNHELTVTECASQLLSISIFPLLRWATACARNGRQIQRAPPACLAAYKCVPVG